MGNGNRNPTPEIVSVSKLSSRREINLNLNWGEGGTWGEVSGYACVEVEDEVSRISREITDKFR